MELDNMTAVSYINWAGGKEVHNQTNVIMSPGACFSGVSREKYECQCQSTCQIAEEVTLLQINIVHEE